MSNAPTTPADPPRVRTARRIGMSLVVALIVWTIAAVTVGVLRGIAAYEDQHQAAPTDHD